MRVLLVSTNREQHPQPVYPLGLDCMRAICDQLGHETKIFDLAFQKETVFAELEQEVASFAPDINLLSFRNVDSIQAFSVKSYVPDLIAATAAIRRCSSAPIVLGGSGYSLFPGELLQASEADFGIRGAGESCLPLLLSAIHSKKEVSTIPGIVFRGPDQHKSSTFGPAPVTTPPMRFERSPQLVRRYWQAGGLMNLQVQRGCPLNCIYCTYPAIEGRQVLKRSISETVDEMSALKESFAVDHFFIVDSVFNLNPELPDALANELLARKLNIKWTAYFLPKGVTLKRAELWRSAGLTSIEFGVDTLSNKLLASYRKNFTTKDVFEACAACATAQIPHSLFLLAGGPGETTDTLDETLSNCAKLPKTVFVLLTGMRIYPGTELHAYALREGVITPQTDLLEPRFYISPSLKVDLLHHRLKQLEQDSRWLIDGHGLGEREEMAALLRSAGARGSLWERCSPLEV